MAKIYGNRYEVIKLIGKGGMADVYLALDNVLNREVAIKVLKSDLESDSVSLERFNREAHAATSLIHPNIVEIYDVGEDEESHYIVMEFVKGHTLKQLIQRRGPIPVKESVYIIRQLALALLEAHKNGIIHRDVKSQNVLIKSDGTIKMADFGIAQMANAMQLTGDNSVLGSVHYLAPELAKGEQADMQSDIYSLGIVFYELLTGDVPFKADKAIEVAIKHVRECVPDVRTINPDIPQSVSNIIIRATARNREERYSNIALMIKDLNVCLRKEHADDKKLVLGSSQSKEKSDISLDSSVKKNIRKKKEEKNGKTLSAMFIVLIAIFSTIMVLVILFLCGIIGTGKKYTVVPDIASLSIVEANDILDKEYLSIDYASIERVMTDDIRQGVIISVLPEPGTKVERGSKIRLVVSDGTYVTMKDYTGENIDVVRSYLKDMNFIVTAVPVESELESGTIVSQLSMEPGAKYNPNISNMVTFEYSEYKSILIPFGTRGRYYGDVAYELEEAGFTVRVVSVSIDSLSDEDKARYGNSGTVVNVEPGEGTLYTQESESEIVIYYCE